MIAPALIFILVMCIALGIENGCFPPSSRGIRGPRPADTANQLG